METNELKPRNMYNNS